MKNLILAIVILAVFSCGEKDDSKNYYLTLQNGSDFVIYNILVSMEMGDPGEIAIDSLLASQQTEKYKFVFDRTGGCGLYQTNNPCAEEFSGEYIQNDTLKAFSVLLFGLSNDITVVFENDDYFVVEN